ncbi:MAG: YdiU family protein [Wenzhouxiangellaceae bacterium]|nr:YdiU family protein [Wenzhouxiangellaceae bacterium]
MNSITFDHSYHRLPESFYARARPLSVRAPELIAFNHELAAALGLELSSVDRSALALLFSGNRLPESAEPIALAYAGHQFGHFVPQLGDGRAHLLGELLAPDGVRHDLQLKGSGRTPFSRGGDGRAALGPVLREYLLSEAMHALGVPTTRALAAVTTGETVMRDVPRPGAIVARVARSHIRVGTFEYFAARGDQAALAVLADYAIGRHDPELGKLDDRYARWLEAILDRQARLVARWLSLGFIHGVMNTDNTAVSGETIDYGPCAFMDHYDPAQVFSSIDRNGRYAYANQPRIAHWNLARLAEALLGLLSTDRQQATEIANDILEGFAARFERYWLGAMRPKLGLQQADDDDAALIQDLLDLMEAQRADFSQTFRKLANLVAQDRNAAELQFESQPALDAWLQRWRRRLQNEPGGPAAAARLMAAHNPAFIPRNHQVERAIRAAEDRGDFSIFHELRQLLVQPYRNQPEFTAYAEPPEPHERVLQTFCGT